MTSKYRVEYALKVHRRDQLIEWIKGLLAVPFVLHSQPAAAYDERPDVVAKAATNARRRYAEIMRDVEGLINEHIAHQKNGTESRSKLKMLVPAVGSFFTPLFLEEAFLYQDNRRRMSSRRFVPPSFNDIRVTLNTSQLMGLVRKGPLELVTFDGDVTLYADGQNLDPENPVIPRILRLLSRGVNVGIVTAAGYVEASSYHTRLHGLLDAVKAGVESKQLSHPRVVVVGGESQYLFDFSSASPHCLRRVPRTDWMPNVMLSWTEVGIKCLLDIAEEALHECIETLGLDARIVRKERAVGIVPTATGPGAPKLAREQLEETVLITQQRIEMLGPKIPFCAFNGGNDVFVDIGDKSWGVLACQNYFGGIEKNKTLHVGDQFLSAGSNDFKARLACTTAWIANPLETVQLLDEMEALSTGRQPSS